MAFVNSVALVNANFENINFSNGIMPVKIADLNLSSDQLLYTTDGSNISGLNLGNGLNVQTNYIETIGNPDIQLTANSLFVNDNIQSIQSKIDVVSQADVINISPGSFGDAPVTITDKYNIALVGPNVGNTICEVLQNFTIDETSELIRISNINFKGTLNSIKGVGRHYFNNCVFTGTTGPGILRLQVSIGKNSSKYMTFTNCEFNSYCDVIIEGTFSSVVYFINCNFGGATIYLNQAYPQQVIFSNCANFQSLPSATKSTLIGLNVLSTGESQVSATTVDSSKYFNIVQGTDLLKSSDNPNTCLTSDGANGMKWTPLGGPSSYYNVFFYIGQQPNPNSGATTVTLFNIVNQANVIPNLKCLLRCTFGFQHVGNNKITAFKLYDTSSGGNVLIQTISQTCPSGHQTITLLFNQMLGGSTYNLNYRIDASSDTNIIIDANDSCTVEVYEIQSN